MKAVLFTTVLAALFISLAFSLAGCGMHVTADTVDVNHTVTIDLSAITSYCELSCNGDASCTQACLQQFVELLSAQNKCLAGYDCPR